MKHGVTYGWYPARVVIHPWATEADIERMFEFLDEEDLHLGRECQHGAGEGRLVIRLEQGRVSAGEARAKAPVVQFAQ